MSILHDAGDAYDSIPGFGSSGLCLYQSSYNSVTFTKKNCATIVDASNGWMNYNYDGTMSHTNIRSIKVKISISVDTQGFRGVLDAMLRIGFAVAWLTHPKNK